MRNWAGVEIFVANGPTGIKTGAMERRIKINIFVWYALVGATSRPRSILQYKLTRKASFLLLPQLWANLLQICNIIAVLEAIKK